MGQPVARHLAGTLLKKSQSPQIKIAYIQYLSGADSYIAKARWFYESLKISFELIPIDLDAGYHSQSLDGIRNADVLHIPGGNTFALIKAVRNRSASDHITGFSRSGRLVVGVSAGALILAPSIGTAGVGDDAESRDGDDRGLGIIDFEPFPHWNTLNHFEAELVEYSKRTAHPIRIFDDSSGIAISPEGITTFGKERIMNKGNLREAG